jgi:VIT1/CCC1 family predicted Fe2+/Mn2+ transporter
VVDLENANTIRAGVFGVQDGIVSTFGLTMGVAGSVAAGQISPEAILVAGIAGLVSGSLSMGAGEYVSVRTQRELLARRGDRSDDDNVNPLKAALANSGLFVLGAVVPLVPFVFLAGLAAVAASSVMSVVALFTAGALLTRLTGQSPWRSGMRMLLIGGGAGVLGYAVGTLLGVVV